jgi:hypothetical protein
MQSRLIGKELLAPMNAPAASNHPADDAVGAVIIFDIQKIL